MESVEITPAMIDAGFAKLEAANITDDLLEADKEVVREIFLAMLDQCHRDARADPA